MQHDGQHAHTRHQQARDLRGPKTLSEYNRGHQHDNRSSSSATARWTQASSGARCHCGTRHRPPSCARELRRRTFASRFAAAWLQARFNILAFGGMTSHTRLLRCHDQVSRFSVKIHRSAKKVIENQQVVGVGFESHQPPHSNIPAHRAPSHDGPKPRSRSTTPGLFCWLIASRRLVMSCAVGSCCLFPCVGWWQGNPSG